MGYDDLYFMDIDPDTEEHCIVQSRVGLERGGGTLSRELCRLPVCRDKRRPHSVRR